jgi:hypothetical protein
MVRITLILTTNYNKEACIRSETKRENLFFFFFFGGEKVRGWIICSHLCSNCYDEVIAKPTSKTEKEK